jgi:hypothetical protein
MLKKTVFMAVATLAILSLHFIFLIDEKPEGSQMFPESRESPTSTFVIQVPSKPSTGWEKIAQGLASAKGDNDSVCLLTSTLSAQCIPDIPEPDPVNVADYGTGAAVIENLTTTHHAWDRLIDFVFRSPSPSLEPPSVVIDGSNGGNTTWCFRGRRGFLTVFLSRLAVVHGFSIVLKDRAVTVRTSKTNIQTWGFVENQRHGDKLRKASLTIKMRNNIPVLGAGTTVLLGEIENSSQSSSQVFRVFPEILKLHIPFRIISFVVEIVEDVEGYWGWSEHTCIQRVEVNASIVI